MSQEHILRYWDYWLLWRMTGKRVEAFVLATGWDGPLPKLMLEVFFELDNVMDKMESQWLENEVRKKRNA